MVQIKAQGDTEKVLQKQRHILLAASKLFRSNGFHATGMREIAAGAGMTVGNLYYYFRHKEEILAFCQEETLNRLQSLVERVRSKPGRAADRLGSLIVGHVRCLNEGIPGSLAHLELPESISATLKAKRDTYEEDLRRLIREGMQESDFAPCDEKVAALAILGAVNWTVRWYRADGASPAEEIGVAFATQLVSGLLAPGARKAINPQSWIADGESGPQNDEVDDG